MLQKECTPLLPSFTNTKSCLEEEKDIHNGTKEELDYLKDSVMIKNNGRVKLAASSLRDASILTQSDNTALNITDQYYYRILKNESVTNISKICRRILTYQLVAIVTQACVIGLTLLSFIEPPTWCRNFTRNGESNNVIIGCDVAMQIQGKPAFFSDDLEQEEKSTVYYYPNAGISLLDLQQSLMMERLIYLVLAHTLISFGSYNFSLKKYFALEVLDSPDVITKRSFKTTSVVRIVRLISIIALINNRHLNNDEKRSLFSVIFRIILFITFSDAVQQQFIFSAKVMTSLISVSAILLLIIFFYGVFGVVLFYGTKEGDDFFSNLLDSMWNLWKSTTTVIYPVRHNYSND